MDKDDASSAAKEEKIRSLENYINDLEKQDALAKKDKAVYEQKVELLELQIRESKQREQNMNKMHSTMIAALKQESAKRSEIPRELEITNAMYKKELAEAKEKYQEDIKSFQNKIKELELAKAEAESNLKQVATKSALVEREWKLKFEETMGKCKALEWKIKQNEEERKKQSEIAALDAQVKLSNKSVELEKVKAEHQRELDNIKNKCDNALKEIASLHKQEKDSLETRWEEAQAELKQSKLRYLEEIHELNAELTDTKQKAKYLEEQAQNFKGLKQRLYKAKQLLEVSEEMKTELKKARKQIVEMKAYIIKLESNEKRLKGSVSEKVTELEETRVSLKRRLSTERKRMQEDFNQERIQIMKELASKGREVDELSRRLKKSREKVDQHMDEVKRVVPELSNQHVFYRFGKDETMNAPRAFESNNNKVEYKQLKECEQMVDSASRMECRNCKKLMSTEAFWDHVISGITCEFCAEAPSEVASLKAELKEAKESFTKLEEAKIETETSLKAEIKFLITKLMKRKSGESEQRPLRSISINEQVSRNSGAIKTARETPTKSQMRGREMDTQRTIKKFSSQASPNTTLKNALVKVTQGGFYNIPRVSVEGTYRKKVNLDESDITEGTFTRTEEGFTETLEGKDMPSVPRHSKITC